MANCIFTMGSITQSLKAKRILAEHSIPVSTTKLSSNHDKKGCVHGIEFNCSQQNNITRILSANGIGFEEYRT